jgi:5-methylcytosine-specific restriction endonuclease McrA
MKFEIPKVIHEMPSDEVLTEMAVLADFADVRFAKWVIRRRLLDAVIRTKLSESQNHRCCYCGRVTNNIPFSKLQATLEHVIPKSRGGTNDYDNLVMACSACNNNRGSLPLECEELVKAAA